MSFDGSDRAHRGGLQERPLLQDHPLAWRITLVLWLLSGFLFVALAVPVLADVVDEIDLVVHGWAVDLEWQPAVTAAEALDFVGSVWVTAPIIVAVTMWLAWKRRWEAFAAWLIAMFVSQLMIGPIKDLYMRVRPPDSLVETTSWSFPSGHSVAGAAISIALVIVLVPAGARRRNWEMLAAGFAVVMALSRVYLRAHWLADVAAGAALGAGIAVASAVVVHWIDDVRESREGAPPDAT